jgi:membrane-bound serine protease (ClpP class)
MIPAIIVISLFFIAVISLAFKAQLRKPETGGEGMAGREGVTVTHVHHDGKVLIDGEYWNAESESTIEEGKRVKVLSVSGLKLIVEKVK